MFTDYVDCEIDIQPRNGDIFPFSVHAPGGDARGTLHLPTSDPVYQELARQLATLFTDEQLLTQLGQILFHALFQQQVKDVFIRTQGILKAGQGLRIKLNIAPSAQEVAALPWEFLYDPESGPLALLDTPIVRYLPQQAVIPSLTTALPLRVLLTGAQTPPPADIDRELREVEATLAGMGEHVQITVEPHLTTSKLRARLREGFHIWHFIGHGGFSRDGATGLLKFEDTSGDIADVTARELGIMLQGSGLRLVVLSACNSATLVIDPLRSMAPALVRAQIPAVVAMQFSVPQEAARAFAGEFYRTLAEGWPIDACVTEGRKAVMNTTGLGNADWGIPVVYTRAGDGRLFNLRMLSSTTKALDNISADPTQIKSISTHHKAAEDLGPREAELARLLRGPGSRSRVFISYKRNATPDDPLAMRLYRAFEQAGHSVFVDQRMKVGVEWAREIQRQIEACDFLVVLLSETSAQSEMVAKEVEYAHKYNQRTGKSRLLPVRISYPTALPYQLSHYLDHLQYAAWNNDADDERLIRQLLDVISDFEPLPAPGPLPPPSEPVSPFGRNPKPYADPRFIDALREPGGGVRLRSEFYIERDGDERLRREIPKPYGTTTTIRAPRQTGKSSLLIRGIAQAQQQGSKVVSIDLQPVDDSYLHNMDTFLRYFATFIVTKLRLDTDEVEKAWRSSLGASDKTTYLMEDYILPQVGGNVVLAIDEADVLLKTSFHDSFFGLLRFWHNNRAMNELWENLDIMMVISTEPHLLIGDVTQSPFNVGLKIPLEDFDDAQVRELNRRYRSPLDERDIPAALDFLNGHPYLTRKALYTLVTEQMAWGQLNRVATSQKSPFGDHLRRYLWLLRDQPQLRSALKQIIARGHCPDEIAFYRLLQAGLIKGADSQSCTCRCGLYRDYLKDKL